MPGIDLSSSREVVRLSETYAALYAAVGVHPNQAQSWTENSLAELKELATCPRVLAIGEIGLDYYRDGAPRSVQQRIFHAQLELAAAVGKPVIIHSRQSINELWPVLQEWQQELTRKGAPLSLRPGVLHSYEGDPETARLAIGQHFFIGISGPVTFPNAAESRRTVAALPLEGIVLETDAPFLAPQPVRGQRNEPCNIPMIADKIAEIHALPVHFVAETTTRNADHLFGWRPVY